MALPTSGQLTLAQIRDEFGSGTTSNVSLRTLSAAAGLSAPDAFNEFYGLSAFTPPSLSVTSGVVGLTGSGTSASPYYIEFQTDYADNFSVPGVSYWYEAYAQFAAPSAGTYTMVYDWDFASWTDFNGSNLSAQITNPTYFYEEIYRNGTSSIDALVALSPRTTSHTVSAGQNMGVTLRLIQDFFDFFVYARLKIYFY